MNSIISQIENYWMYCQYENKYSKKILLSVLVGLMMIIVFCIFYHSSAFKEEEKSHKKEDFLVFEDILDAKHKPRADGGNIFFLETHKNENNSLYLTARQACSVESAAKMNPKLDVFLLVFSNATSPNATSLSLIKAIQSYENVRVNHVDILNFSRNSPIEEWMQTGRLFNSQHILRHISDILRILALWKYSGTYFDLDVIVKKPISQRGKNFACIQEDGLVNSAIVNLDSKLGKSIAEKNFKQVIDHFDGNVWSGNGPDVLSSIVKSMCNTTDALKMNRANCHGFQVLPRSDCFAISYQNWEQFFKAKYFNAVLNATKDSFAVHFWNYLSGKTKLPTKNFNSSYVELARQFCPKVLNASGDFF